jgi:hypothetical protein
MILGQTTKTLSDMSIRQSDKTTAPRKGAVLSVSEPEGTRVLGPNPDRLYGRSWFLNYGRGYRSRFSGYGTAYGLSVLHAPWMRRRFPAGTGAGAAPFAGAVFGLTEYIEKAAPLLRSGSSRIDKAPVADRVRHCSTAHAADS